MKLHTNNHYQTFRTKWLFLRTKYTCILLLLLFQTAKVAKKIDSTTDNNRFFTLLGDIGGYKVIRKHASHSADGIFRMSVRPSRMGRMTLSTRGSAATWSLKRSMPCV